MHIEIKMDDKTIDTRVQKQSILIRKGFFKTSWTKELL